MPVVPEATGICAFNAPLPPANIALESKIVHIVPQKGVSTTLTFVYWSALSLVRIILSGSKKHQTLTGDHHTHDPAHLSPRHRQGRRLVRTRRRSLRSSTRLRRIQGNPRRTVRRVRQRTEQRRLRRLRILQQHRHHQPAAVLAAARKTPVPGHRVRHYLRGRTVHHL